MDSRYSTAGSTYQREARTQLFGNRNVGYGMTPQRMPSPYETSPQVSAKHNESFLSSLEDQNENEMSSMSTKVSALKNLGMLMGSEINKSMALNDDISNNFERGSVTLKNTYNRMVRMSKRAGISWKMWIVFFLMFFGLCFYVWLF